MARCHPTLHYPSAILSVAMTKVEAAYALSGGVDEALMERIANAHGIYGLQALRLNPSMDTLLIQYDASRLRLEDVDRALHAAGIPARRKEE